MIVSMIVNVNDTPRSYRMRIIISVMVSMIVNESMTLCDHIKCAAAYEGGVGVEVYYYYSSYYSSYYIYYFIILVIIIIIIIIIIIM